MKPEIPRSAAAIVDGNPVDVARQITRDTQRNNDNERHGPGETPATPIELADRVKCSRPAAYSLPSRLQHCCSTPTMIFQHEAERLADASGRPAVP